MFTQLYGRFLAWVVIKILMPRMPIMRIADINGEAQVLIFATNRWMLVNGMLQILEEENVKISESGTDIPD